MNKSLKLLVGIDLSEMDHYLMDYIKALDLIFDIEKVTFLHNLKIGELPKEMIVAERLELIKEKIKNKVNQQLRDKNVQHDFEILITSESFSELAFHSFSKKRYFDLLILGNKQNLEGNGALGQKLINLMPSALLLVPETYSIPIEKVVDAIDFSKYTLPIMNWAMRFKNNSKGQKINHSAVYVSKVHRGFYLAMNDLDIEEISKKDSAEKRKKWVNSFGDYAELEIISAVEKSISTSLIEYADQQKADLMILGVKGSSKIKELFLGSVANHLFSKSTDTSLLFVKE